AQQAKQSQSGRSGRRTEHGKSSKNLRPPYWRFLSIRCQSDSMRILLVEDEAELAQRVVANLSRHGMTCERTATAEDALDFVSDGFTVMVVDIGLPGMSGIELVR